jgi:CRISPR-associated endonuclease Cas1
MNEMIKREAVPIRDGIVVLSGFGIRVRVERNHLTVEDGCGLDRREARFSKAPARLRRLVIIGHTGFVSLEAMRWLADAKAALVVIDADGTVVAATAPQRVNDSRLRRLQAIAVSTPTGTAIVRELLGAKLDGQRRVLGSIGAIDARTEGVFDELIARNAAASTVDECLAAEAAAAVVYFGAWQGRVAAQFVKRDEGVAPEHWRRFAGRHSLLTGEPRAATDPVGALLNYSYRLLEAETRIALLTFGLDPGLGFAHVDGHRDSLALDVMEAVRPEVDAWLLGFLRKRPFRTREFLEERDGRCRLTPPLAHEVASTIGCWRSLVTPVVERLARLLGNSERELLQGFALTPRAAPQRLTPSDRRTRSRVEAAVDRRGKREATFAVDPRCHNCGEPLSGKRCRDCGFTPVTVDDPGADRQRLVMMDRQRTNREWSGDDGGLDFASDILPGLQGVTLRRIMEATGLSKRFASQIRNGLAVPHRRHWKALSEAARTKTIK